VSSCGEDKIGASLGDPAQGTRSHGALAGILMGTVAIVALTGLAAPAASHVLAFPLLLAIILFPGIVITRLCGEPRNLHPLMRLALWFVVGLAMLAVVGFIGIVTRMPLSLLMTITVFAYAAGMVAAIIMLFQGKGMQGSSDYNRIAAAILIVTAIALAIGTLATPRDSDDWFYLAYIRDYVNDIPLNSMDAIFDAGHQASPRAWYGGWWVAEAMLSRAVGIDPVGLHQVIMPILLLPFAVLALFTLADRVFRSERMAYLALFLQVVFYLSSALPSDSAGWAVLCRTAQDKTVSGFIMVPIVTVLALDLLRTMSSRERKRDESSHWGLALLYGLCLAGATLVHPMAAIWSAIAVLPFMVVETIRQRRRSIGSALLLAVIPFILCAAILLEGRVATVSTLEGRELGPHEGKGLSSFFEPEFPGAGVRPEAGDRVLELSAKIHIGHPLLVTRYPLAMLGFVLTFLLLKYVRQSEAARYLVVVTFSIMVLTFVPGLANITSAVVTRKMLYRLTWLLPWGLTTAFVLDRIVPRARWEWLVAVLLALAVARGNPANYFSYLSGTRNTGRADRELEEVLHVLAAEPRPQGVVLASHETSLRIPGFVVDAYPVTFRSGGPRTPDEIRDLLATGELEGRVREEIETLGVQYVIARKSRSLAKSLERGAPWVQSVYENKDYGLWRVDLR
jgi:hypothetical protein